METKYIRVPFDLKLAKDITSGNKDGKIVTRDGRNVRVLCWDKADYDSPIVGLIKCGATENIEKFMIDGRWHCDGDEESNLDLKIEIPEYMTYKDGDILISNIGSPFIFNGRISKRGNFGSYYGINCNGDPILGSDEWTAEVKGYANEKQKNILMGHLKRDYSCIAKEYLERFFPNHSNSSNIGKNYEFKPFDKVLVRDSIGETWVADIFSNYRKDPDYSYTTLGGSTWKCCIPYNEQTAHLLGTTKSPD